MRVVRAVLASLLLAAAAHADCAGDCGGDGEVTVNDLVVAVSIALGSAPLTQCPAADANANGEVSVDDLVAAVSAALLGCEGDRTPTAAPPTATPTPTPSHPPTPTETPAVGPQILFFGVASADDQVQAPSGEDPSGVPIYQRTFGFGFRLVVEARRGTAGLSVGGEAFSSDGAPALQVQATRPLGDGSGAVCDIVTPPFGGVPGIDPPRFDDSAAVVDALNDFGCRFVDGSGNPFARGCATSCVRNTNGDYACVDDDTLAQFCVLVDTPLQFPPGDTLVTVRVRDELRNGEPGNLGAPRRLIIRVQP